MTKAETPAQARNNVEGGYPSFAGTDKMRSERLQRIIAATAPPLEPKTCYRMSAYTLETKSVGA